MMEHNLDVVQLSVEYRSQRIQDDFRRSRANRRRRLTGPGPLRRAMGKALIATGTRIGGVTTQPAMTSASATPAVATR